jgi:hypothetical protein
MLLFLKRLRELKALAQRTLNDSQERYKRNYDNSVREKSEEFPVGGWLYSTFGKKSRNPEKVRSSPARRSVPIMYWRHTVERSYSSKVPIAISFSPIG